jgi:hypothetical protein
VVPIDLLHTSTTRAGPIAATLGGVPKNQAMRIVLLFHRRQRTLSLPAFGFADA